MGHQPIERAPVSDILLCTAREKTDAALPGWRLQLHSPTAVAQPRTSRWIGAFAWLSTLLVVAVAHGQAGEGAAPADVSPTLADERTRIIEEVKRKDLSEAEVREWIGFAEEIKKHAKRDLSLAERAARALKNPWVFFGFAAQGIFMMRFVVQLVASERKKRSHVPVAFWYLSLVGGLMLLVYALARRDPVFVLGQALGIVIYARNLMLIRSRNAKMLDRLDDRAERNRTATAAANGAESP